MKKLLFSLVLFLLATCLSAQRERNYIYILDCSNSMLDNQIGSQTLWQATLDYLHSDIERQTPTSQINIVPFQGKVFPTTQCQKSELSWPKFYDGVKDCPQQLTGTNICRAWDMALTMQDPNKDNYLFLLTDGEDNFEGVDAVCQRIRAWCEKVRNSYGYYVMLSKEATHPKIVAEVERCHNMFAVDGQKGLKPFGSIEKTDFTYNTLEPKDLEVPVSTAGTFRAHVNNSDSRFQVELVDNLIRDGKGILRVTPKVNLAEMEQVMRLTPQLEGEDLNLLNPDLNIVVNNMPERLLSLPSQEVNAGDASWYDAFLWSDAKTPDTLCVALDPVFNQAAKDAGSKVRLQIRSVDKEGIVRSLDPDVAFFVNGQKAYDGLVSLDANQPLDVSLVFAREAQEGKHYFELRVVPGSAQRLERINDEGPELYQTTLRADYDVDTNPLKVFLLWFISLLAAALLLWLCVLRFIFFPRIKLKHLQIESSPIYKNPVIKGCRKVVFTNRRQRQSFVNSLFTGPVKYVCDDIFDNEWYVTPGTRKDRIRANSVGGYQMNPPGNTLCRHETVTLRSNATGRIIQITPN